LFVLAVLAAQHYDSHWMIILKSVAMVSYSAPMQCVAYLNTATFSSAQHLLNVDLDLLTF